MFTERHESSMHLRSAQPDVLSQSRPGQSLVPIGPSRLLLYLVTFRGPGFVLARDYGCTQRSDIQRVSSKYTSASNASLRRAISCTNIQVASFPRSQRHLPSSQSEIKPPEATSHPTTLDILDAALPNLLTIPLT